MTSQFLAYDEGYTGGVSLSTGWVAGAEGGAKSIVTGQLAGAGTVRVWSSGIAARRSARRCTWRARTITTTTSSSRQIASFEPFAGAHARGDGGDHQHHRRGRSSGQRRGARRSEVRKYGLARAAPDATTLAPKLVATLPVLPGVPPAAPLGWARPSRAGARTPW